jgi:hypothetical protein
MKAIKITDDVHARLTGILGLLMAKSRKPQTYADALRALTTQAILLPEEMVSHIKDIVANKDLGYTSLEEFVKDAVRDKLEAVTKKTRASKSNAAEKA